MPTPCPAWILYSASPRFCQIYAKAISECDQVFILSAKYGLLDPFTVIHPYDLILSDLDESKAQVWAQQVVKKIQALDYTHLFSYLSGQYVNAISDSVSFDYQLSGSFFEVAKKIGKQPKLFDKDWVMNWIIEMVYEKKVCSVDDIKRALIQRNYASKTVTAQINRLKNCPLFIVKGQFVRYKYL